MIIMLFLSCFLIVGCSNYSCNIEENKINKINSNYKNRICIKNKHYSTFFKQ